MAGQTPRWWSKDTIAVVTGSNKGIGYEIVKGLAKNGVTTVLTARDTGRGQKAVESLKAEGIDSVVFHPLEVNSAESVDKLATWLKNEFGGVDILVNNAAMALAEVSYEAAKTVLDTNYYGVKLVTNALFPLLRPGARIVNVSSKRGQLMCLEGDSLREKLGDEQNLSLEMVDSYASKYLEDVKAGRWKEEGWATTYSLYANTKVLLNAYTRAFAKTLTGTSGTEQVYVNVVYPGYIGTDSNNHSGHGTTEEGADTEVWLSLLPKEGYPNGQFFFKREPLEW